MCKLELHKVCTLFLHDVLYASDIWWNLVSVFILFYLGFNLNFHDLVMELYLGTTYYGSGFILDGFMVLDIDNYVFSNTNDSYFLLMTTSRNACDSVIIWHAKLRHIGQGRMNRLARENLLSQFTKIDMPTCEYSLVDKTTRKPFRKGTRTKTPLQLIYFDICDPMRIRAKQGMRSCTSSHL